MAGCDTCPEMVLGVLRQECQTTLQQVREIKSLVGILNRAVRELEQGALDELNRLVALIPDPPLFDLRELVNIVTCPLTPQSIITEMFTEAIIKSEQQVASIPMPARIPAQLAAFNRGMVQEGLYTTTVFRGVKGILLSLAAQVDAVINQIYEIIDYFKTSSKFKWALDILFRFMAEIDRVVAGSATFVMRLAITSANAALVRTICPALYADNTLPYQEFVEEMSSFSFDGFLPGGCDDHIKPFLTPVAAIQAKIVGWQTAQFVLIV